MLSNQVNEKKIIILTYLPKVSLSERQKTKLSFEFVFDLYFCTFDKINIGYPVNLVLPDITHCFLNYQQGYVQNNSIQEDSLSFSFESSAYYTCLQTSALLAENATDITHPLINFHFSFKIQLRKSLFWKIPL